MMAANARRAVDDYNRGEQEKLSQSARTVEENIHRLVQNDRDIKSKMNEMLKTLNEFEKTNVKQAEYGTATRLVMGVGLPMLFFGPVGVVAGSLFIATGTLLGIDNSMDKNKHEFVSSKKFRKIQKELLNFCNRHEALCQQLRISVVNFSYVVQVSEKLTDAQKNKWKIVLCNFLKSDVKFFRKLSEEINSVANGVKDFIVNFWDPIKGPIVTEEQITLRRVMEECIKDVGTEIQQLETRHVHAVRIRQRFMTDE